MPEPNVAIVEPVIEPEVKERQETDAYIAERAKERNAPPPPVVIDTTTPKTPEEAAKEILAAIPEHLKGKTAEEVKTLLEQAAPAEMVDRQAVDAYIDERNKAKKRKNRGGVGGTQARIDQLTKEKADAEAKTAEALKVAEEAKKAAEVKPPEVKTEPAKVETPKEAPKLAEYTDIDKYNTDMALWAASQVKPAEKPPEVKPTEPAKPDPNAALRKEEFDRFLEKGKALITRYPDFYVTLEAAHVRGLTMSEPARIAITMLAAPEVAYWLAKPDNDLAARNFMKLDDFQQVIEVGKIAERLAVKPSDFVSSAPAPGTRLNGNAVPSVQLNEITDTDEYIRQRKQQRRAHR
jgi:hypothetical protein